MLTSYGGRHGQPGLLQTGTGEVLVDANLDGAWRVQHDGAARLHALQEIHSEDDLFQRSRRHCANEHCMEISKRIRSSGDLAVNFPEIEGLRFAIKRYCGTPQV